MQRSFPFSNVASLVFSLAIFFFSSPVHGQAPTAAPAPASDPAPATVQAKAAAAQSTDPAIERGRKLFVQSCGFCHGANATGGRGPDLMRSPIIAHDLKGDLIGDVIRHGRPDKGMPAFPVSNDDVAGIAAFLHSRAAEALASAEVPEGYPVEKLLTGNAVAGQKYFDGPGGCNNCHSPAGDLAGVAEKYSAIDLETHMLYPEGRHFKSATVTLPSGEKLTGPLLHLDDFMVAIRDASGVYRSFSRDRVQVDVHDRLSAHRQLLDQLSQADIHNLFAYLQTLQSK
jgi:cytochrome c oxidase cbb3-type subunit III